MIYWKKKYLKNIRNKLKVFSIKNKKKIKEKFNERNNEIIKKFAKSDSLI